MGKLVFKPSLQLIWKSVPVSTWHSQRPTHHHCDKTSRAQPLLQPNQSFQTKTIIIILSDWLSDIYSFKIPYHSDQLSITNNQSWENFSISVRSVVQWYTTLQRLEPTFHLLFTLSRSQERTADFLFIFFKGLPHHPALYHLLVLKTIFFSHPGTVKQTCVVN